MGSNEMTLKQICLASIAILCYLQPNGAIEGKLITCACTTDECRVSHNVSTCSTNSICFTQLLFYRSNGPAHVSRGCIDYRTPLLCENKPPTSTVATVWPILYCCNYSMCNREVTPTMPPWYSTTSIYNSSTIGANVTTITDRQSTKTNSISTSSYTYSSGTHGTTLKNSLESTTTDPRPKIISPVYMTVLALGVAILVLIGVIAACLLRRQQQQQRLYTRHWVTMDHEAAGYLKGQPCLSPPADINFIKPGGLQLVNVSTDEDDDGHENGEIGRSRFTVDHHRYPASLLLLHPSFTPGPINTCAPNAVPNSYMP